MPIQKVQHPYEFLVRWRDGQLSGAHVGYIEQLMDEDGSVISHKVLDVMPVAIGGAQGFPLATVVNQLQVDAIARGDAEQARADALQAQLTEREAELKTAQEAAAAEAATLREQLAAAQAEIERLTAPAPQIIVP